jgi:hypothetical protein
MFKDSRRGSLFVAQPASVVVLLLMATMCSTPKRVSITPMPIEGDTVVEVNGEIGITLDVDNPGNLPLEFVWEPSKGKVTPFGDSSTATYKAPDEPGIAIIVVKAMYEGEKVAEGSMQIKVVEPAAEVTSTPTPTPVSPTDTPTPTITEPPATDTPTPSPTPDCQSFRPPLKGAADFAGDVEIQTPADCTTGLPSESPIPVAGTYEGIPGDVDIWVLVYPPNMVYYIQSPSACDGAKMAQTGGNWQVPVYLGAKGGDPEWFDIVVVLADQEASQFFSSSVKQMCQSRQYYGISAAQLEQMNITEKNYITVQTLD